MCQLQSKVSRLEASLKKLKEQDKETRKDILSYQERIVSLQTDLDKKVCACYTYVCTICIWLWYFQMSQQFFS